MTDKKIKSHEGHFRRLKERYLKGGLKGFHDYEIVELLLTLGEQRKDRKKEAKTALKKFGSLKGVLDATPRRLREIKGLGPKNIFGLLLIRDMVAVYLKARAQEKPLAGSPREVVTYLRHSFSGLDKEVFKVVYLDNTNRVMEAEELFQGTIDQSAVYPRELIASALDNKASRLILAHNHPGGSLRPSPEDLKITGRLKKACGAVDIAIIDHIIVAGERYFSFREHGLI